MYLGGDYYSAPVVLVRDGAGSWTFYNILRDHLGSIMQITTVEGMPVAEYSYDPWGRMRNPVNQQVYAVGSEPALFLGRGFTGHEHLPMFGLVNMNARLYDPVLGRFLSPDPYIQDPELTQNYNRYAYALNNPLLYVDIDGNTWFSKLGKWIDKNGTQIITVAATVVVVAAVTVATAGMGTIAAGAINGVIGAAAGMAGGAAAKWAAKHVSNFALNSLKVAGKSAIGGSISGAVGGSVAGAVGGLVTGYALTGDINTALKMAGQGAIFGGISGAVLGGYRGYKDAKALGNNAWTGKGWPTPPGEGPFTSGTPSRAKAAARGERSIYDKHGGEWRFDAKGHQPDYKSHWDYKAPGNNKPWENIYNNLKLKR